MASSLVQYHDTTFTPLGLWQLNGDLTDASGNGNTLSVRAGNAHYGEISPGVRGFVSDGSSRIGLSSFVSSLAVTGDITLEMLLVVSPGAYASGNALISHDGVGEVLAGNYLYSIYYNNMQLEYFAELSSGTNIVYDLDELMPTTLCHFAMTRTSNVIQFYLNGRTLGAASSTLSTPAGGTSGLFSIGGDTNGPLPGPVVTMASVKVIGSALNATQVKSEYTRTLGGFYGL